LFTKENMRTILGILESSVHMPQGHSHHPEGNVCNHSLQVFSHALRESDDVDAVMAALTHDLGKALSTEHKGHEKLSVEILRYESIVSEKTICLVANHMRVHTYIEGTMRRFKKSLDMPNHPYFVDLIRLHRWDRMGRNPFRRINFDEEKILEQLNSKVVKVG